MLKVQPQAQNIIAYYTKAPTQDKRQQLQGSYSNASSSSSGRGWLAAWRSSSSCLQKLFANVKIVYRQTYTHAPLFQSHTQMYQQYGSILKLIWSYNTWVNFNKNF